MPPLPRYCLTTLVWPFGSRAGRVARISARVWYRTALRLPSPHSRGGIGVPPLYPSENTVRVGQRQKQPLSGHLAKAGDSRQLNDPGPFLDRIDPGPRAVATCLSWIPDLCGKVLCHRASWVQSLFPAGAFEPPGHHRGCSFWARPLFRPSPVAPGTRLLGTADYSFLGRTCSPNFVD